MKKSERLNQELIFLKDRKAFQLRDLMEKFSISKRTALRDIAELEALGAPLYTEPGRLGGYRLLPHALSIPVYFRDEEIAAILFALQALQDLSTTPFDKSYRQIYDKLWAALSSGQQEDLRHQLSHVTYHSIPSVTVNPFLKEIFAVAGKPVLLQLHYRQKQEEKLCLYVQDLFFQTRVWYFNGYDLGAQKWRVFRCDCIRACRRLSREEAPALPFRSEAEARSSLEQSRSRQETLAFACRLTAAGREHFLKTDFYHMHLQPEPEGTFLLTGTVDPVNLPYLLDYFITFGQGLEVLAPASLVTAYRQILRKMLER